MTRIHRIGGGDPGMPSSDSWPTPSELAADSDTYPVPDDGDLHCCPCGRREFYAEHTPTGRHVHDDEGRRVDECPNCERLLTIGAPE